LDIKNSKTAYSIQKMENQLSIHPENICVKIGCVFFNYPNLKSVLKFNFSRMKPRRMQEWTLCVALWTVSVLG